jgi:hypothetical protein
MLTSMLGPVIPMIGLTAGALYGMMQFNEREVISSIESVGDGTLKITVLKSPLVSYEIRANVKDIKSVCSVGDDDLGADDVDGNIVQVSEYTDA